MRVAILGLGGVGTAAARFLAAGGHRVVGFEQFELDHDRGSSFGASRVIRKVYPDPLYAALMEAAYPLWEELEREAGEELFRRCGGLYFGTEGHPEMAATEAALRTVGVPYERLSARDAQERVPPFRLSSAEYALFDAQSGFVRASRCVQTNARGARAHGAELRFGVAVEAIESGTSGVRLSWDGGGEEFDRVVATAGPWTGPLLADRVRLPLTPTRQQYAHFEPGVHAGAFESDRFPVWIDMESHYYGFPLDGVIPGVKVALHRPGPPLDPDSPDREPRSEVNDDLRRYVRRRLPGADGPVTFSKVCLYTMTPDEDFIVDRLPGEPRVVFIGGLSGHGFKFTVLLGQIAARLAEDADPGHDLSRFRLTRF
ncbi:MAG: N-methyl-L-tryptophan oxidase [Armatimonadota bacterium]